VHICCCVVDCLFRCTVFGRSVCKRNIRRRLRCAVRYSVSFAVSSASAIMCSRQWLSQLQLWRLPPVNNINQHCRQCYRQTLGLLLTAARLQKHHRNKTALAATVACDTAATRALRDQSSLFLCNKGKWRLALHRILFTTVTRRLGGAHLSRSFCIVTDVIQTANVPTPGGFTFVSNTDFKWKRLQVALHDVMRNDRLLS